MYLYYISGWSVRIAEARVLRIIALERSKVQAPAHCLEDGGRNAEGKKKKNDVLSNKGRTR